MKIVQNLWQVGGGSLTAPEDAAVYLVRFGKQAALIDAGCGGSHKRLIDNISLVMPPAVEIPYLFLTHCHYDHVGGAAALREQYRCRKIYQIIYGRLTMKPLLSKARAMGEEAHGRFVKYTPVVTSMVPTSKDIVSGSLRIRKASKIALMGTKLMNSPALVGPI
jgi:glyoxylase-like metal-dependent hydrolase (beta-lactamase superfamily II)